MDGRKNKQKTKRTKEAKAFLKLYYQDVTYKEVAEYFKLALRSCLKSILGANKKTFDLLNFSFYL